MHHDIYALFRVLLLLLMIFGFFAYCAIQSPPAELPPTHLR